MSVHYAPTIRGTVPDVVARTRQILAEQAAAESTGQGVWITHEDPVFYSAVRDALRQQAFKVKEQENGRAFLVTLSDRQRAPDRGGSA